MLGFGYGTIPALGPALDPGRGAWTSAAGSAGGYAALRLPGLRHAVTVSFSPQGDASIEAATDHDLFLALGYVHAEVRLAEMDEGRRLGEGRLAQLGGPSVLASDEFELRLGVLRTHKRVGADAQGQPGRPGADSPTPRASTTTSPGSARAASGRPPVHASRVYPARGPRSTA